MNTSTGIFGLLALLIAVCIYMLPWLAAWGRDHKNTTAIFFINALFGWTGVIWLGLLIWALFWK